MKSRFSLRGSQGVPQDWEAIFASIPALTAQNFDNKFNLVGQDGKVVIMFYRDSCPHCVHFKPNFAEAASKDKNTSYRRLDTADAANEQFMSQLYDEHSKAPFALQGVPTVVAYNNGKFYSMYGRGDNEPEYRSVEGVLHYANGIGAAPITFKK